MERDDIPDRPLFKAAEVCEIAKIPSYVLRSWEKEFPSLGTAAKGGGARVYRRAEVEQILQIKQLVFAQGLTLAGARRRLEGEPAAVDAPLLPLGPPDDVRARVEKVKGDLRALLAFVSRDPEAERPRQDSVSEPVSAQASSGSTAAAPSSDRDAAGTGEAADAVGAGEWPPGSAVTAEPGSAGAAAPARARRPRRGARAQPDLESRVE